MAPTQATRSRPARAGSAQRALASRRQHRKRRARLRRGRGGCQAAASRQTGPATSQCAAGRCVPQRSKGRSEDEADMGAEHAPDGNGAPSKRRSRNESAGTGGRSVLHTFWLYSLGSRGPAGGSSLAKTTLVDNTLERRSVARAADQSVAQYGIEGVEEDV